MNFWKINFLKKKKVNNKNSEIFTMKPMKWLKKSKEKLIKFYTKIKTWNNFTILFKNQKIK